MKIKLVQNVIRCYYHNYCRCQIHQSFEQLLFYEFAPATDRDMFKLFPSRTTEQCATFIFAN
jgi:hypothetical protein